MLPMLHGIAELFASECVPPHRRAVCGNRQHRQAVRTESGINHPRPPVSKPRKKAGSCFGIPYPGCIRLEDSKQPAAIFTKANFRDLALSFAPFSMLNH